MNRTLHYAIALSIALHGVLLFGLSVERRAGLRQLPPPPLEARLVEPPAPALPKPATPTPAPPAPAAAPAPPQPPKLKPVKPKPKAQAAKPSPQPPPIVEAEQPPVPSPEVPAPAAPPAPAPPAVARVEPGPAPPVGPSAEELEATTRAQYRLQIIEAARAHKRYHPLARENNWEGNVVVRMVIGADRSVSLSVKKSSGHPVLDREALAMFRRAQAQVPVPPSLRGKELGFELSVAYGLED